MSQEIWQYTVDGGDEERGSDWRLCVPVVELVRRGQGPQADSPKHKLTLSASEAKPIPSHTSLLEKQLQSPSEQDHHTLGHPVKWQSGWPRWGRGPLTCPRKENHGSSFPALKDVCCRPGMRAGAWEGGTEKIQHWYSEGKVLH